MKHLSDSDLHRNALLLQWFKVKFNLSKSALVALLNIVKVSQSEFCGFYLVNVTPIFPITQIMGVQELSIR
jgi:hypothetical protein